MIGSTIGCPLLSERLVVLVHLTSGIAAIVHTGLVTGEERGFERVLKRLAHFGNTPSFWPGYSRYMTTPAVST